MSIGAGIVAGHGGQAASIHVPCVTLLGGGGAPPGPLTYYVEFDGDSSYIDCGSGMTLNNIWAGKLATVDFWAKVTDYTPDEINAFVYKRDTGTPDTGWSAYVEDLGGGTVRLSFAILGTADSHSTVDISGASLQDWFHLAFCRDDTDDRKIHVAIKGTWQTYVVQQAETGTGKDDSTDHLTLGIADAGTTSGMLYGHISWLRISSGVRFPIGVNFTPPDKCTAPAVDGTTIELWALDEGIGVSTAAEVTSPANDGAMTDCVWQVCT